jgi:hypothetical protein
MPNLVNAYVLFNATTDIYVGNDVPAPTVSINCERLQSYSPRPCWILRQLAPGDGTVILYEPTFNPSSEELLDSNTLQGMFIIQDDQSIIIDVTTVAAFQEACDACCGEVPTIISSNYNGNPTPFTPLTLNTFCIYRADNGSAAAHDNFADDYVGQFIGTAIMRSNFSNISHYTIQSYWSLQQFQSLLINGDVIYIGECSS